jgi:ribonuclease Z
VADTFDSRLVNGPFDDPGLYVAFRYERRALIFDLGSIASLSTREVLKLSHLFVSHTHIDHFNGFDHWLRCSLNREDEVDLFGPRGIIANVQGKLAGYTWNLIRDYPLVLTVHEIQGTERKSVRFAAANSFDPEVVGNGSFGGLLLDEPAFAVRSVILDHRIPCLAFSLEEKSRLNIRPDALDSMDLESGPWLDALKKALREGMPMTMRLEGRTTGGARRELTLQEWREALVLETKGQKIAYVVDSLFSPDNVDKIVNLARDADLFYCEASFARADEAKARGRYHLTGEQSGKLAHMAGVKRLVPFHFSTRYHAEPNRLLEEALEAFASGGPSRVI